MQKTDLYRHFGEAGRLLYVGVSFGALARLQQHRETAHWFNDIARVEVQKFDSRDEAIAAERAAIINESPIHNVMLNRAQLQIDAPPEPSRFGLFVARLISIFSEVKRKRTARAEMFDNCKQKPTRSVVYSRKAVPPELHDSSRVFDDPHRALRVCWPYETLYLYKARLPISLRLRAYRWHVSVRRLPT